MASLERTTGQTLESKAPVLEGTLEYSFSEKCALRCPILRGLATTSIIREAIGEVTGDSVRLNDVIIEAQNNDVLPKRCERGPKTVLAQDFKNAGRRLEDAEYVEANGISPWGEVVFTVCERTFDKMQNSNN